MNIQIPKSMQLPALITGIGAILFSTVAMTKAPIAGWSHLAGENKISAQQQLGESAAAQPSGTRQVRVKPKCNECGVVESMRRINPERDSPAIYEIKVRMRDGSIQVSHDANAATWHRGEHIILLGGSQAGT